MGFFDKIKAAQKVNNAAAQATENKVAAPAAGGASIFKNRMKKIAQATEDTAVSQPAAEQTVETTETKAAEVKAEAPMTMAERHAAIADIVKNVKERNDETEDDILNKVIDEPVKTADAMKVNQPIEEKVEKMEAIQDASSEADDTVAPAPDANANDGETPDDANEDAAQEEPTTQATKEKPVKRRRRRRKNANAEAAPVNTETPTETTETVEAVKAETPAEAAEPVKDTKTAKNSYCDLFDEGHDFDEMSGQYLNYFKTDDWKENVEKYFNSALADEKLKITKDITPGALIYLAADVGNLYDEAMEIWTEQKQILESLGDEHTGVCAAIRGSNAVGPNDAERRRNGFMALANTKLGDVPGVNYVALLAAVRMRFWYIDGVVRRLKAKLNICITLSGALKMEGVVQRAAV